MEIHISSRPMSEEVLGRRLVDKRGPEGRGEGHRWRGQPAGAAHRGQGPLMTGQKPGLLRLVPQPLQTQFSLL